MLGFHSARVILGGEIISAARSGRTFEAQNGDSMGGKVHD
jgi:hypothetical protein